MKHTKVTGYYTKWMTNRTVRIFFSLQRMKKKILPCSSGWQSTPDIKLTRIVGAMIFFYLFLDWFWTLINETRRFRKIGRSSVKRQEQILLFLYLCSQLFMKLFFNRINISFDFVSVQYFQKLVWLYCWCLYALFDH